MKRFQIFCCCFLLGITMSHQLLSQSNMWNQQFGAVATLTGGACMSCPNDNSVFFYNPGAIGFIDSANINVSANVYGLDLVTQKNAIGPGLDLNSTSLNINPQVMLGSLSFKSIPLLKLVYGYLLRHYADYEFEQEVEMNYDVIPMEPGLEYYRGKFEFDYSNFEHWGGIAAGYKVNEHLSVGLGHYGGYVGIRSRIYADKTIDATDPEGEPYSAGVNQRNHYKLNHFYILFKPGVDLKFGRYRIGLSAMLPSIKIWGDGSLSQSLQIYNLDVYGAETGNVLAFFPSLIISADQKNVEANFRQPPSVSAGLQYLAPKFRIALSGEYFFPVREYNIIRGEDDAYIRPGEAFGFTPVQDFTRVKTATYGVLNVGLGAEIALNQRYRFLCGVRTDFNNKVPPYGNDYTDYVNETTPAHWHYLNGSLGLMITKKRSRSFFGVSYNYGFSNYTKNIINFAEPSDQFLLSGPDRENTETVVHQIAIIVGHTFYLNESGIPLLGKKKSSDVKE